MRGTHDQVKSIKQQGLEILFKKFKFGKGTSKYKDNKSDVCKKKIYSYQSLTTYTAGWVDFCRTMKASHYKVNGHSPRTLEEAVGFVPEYLKILENRPGYSGNEHVSVSTVKTRFYALAKVFSIKAKDYDLPKYSRDEIYRSRRPVVGDAHFSEKNNAALITFSRTVGLRNFKELQRIRGTDLLLREDGRWAIHVTGKGGLERDAGLYGSQEDIALVVKMMTDAGDELVWPHVHSNADIHSYRADYAIRVYLTYARDVGGLTKKERYDCRGSKKGIRYDRSALMKASLELGHKRVGVVANNYLYKLDEVLAADDDAHCAERTDSEFLMSEAA